MPASFAPHASATASSLARSSAPSSKDCAPTKRSRTTSSSTASRSAWKMKTLPDVPLPIADGALSLFLLSHAQQTPHQHVLIFVLVQPLAHFRNQLRLPLNGASEVPLHGLRLVFAPD